jgi:hypothetical protein
MFLVTFDLQSLWELPELNDVMDYDRKMAFSA